MKYFLYLELIGEPPTISPQPTIDDEDDSILEDGNFKHFLLIFVIFLIKHWCYFTCRWCNYGKQSFVSSRK